MFSSFEWRVGLRYLRAKRSQRFISAITALSVAGIALGVAALIVVLAVMTGFQGELQRQILGVVSHVVVQSYGGSMEDVEGVLRKVQSRPNVTGAAPFVLANALIYNGGQAYGIALRGVDPEREKGVSNLHVNMVRGDVAAMAGFGVVLGESLARNLGVGLNDRITLMVPKGNVTPAGTVPRVKRFRVAGIFDSGMHEYDTNLAYIHINDAQKLLRLGESVTGIEVKTPHPDLAMGVRQDLEKQLSGHFWIRDWMQMNRNFFNAIKLEKATMFVILSLVVLVAAFNIISSLIMVVMEKGKDIAILKTMGARSHSIMAIFLINGGIIGVGGTLAGLALGLVLAENLERTIGWIERTFGLQILHGDVYFIDKLPAQVLPSDLFWITVISLSISLLSTLYPAWRASRVDPVEALRYE
ncbi:lipoprotein releasing system, transmembrane protein, LolC/E family [Magnetococcus marinus MC-1]|uniref:Lipoprotein releasing system, transmembrane protein, LolC/E family n=1 Tax=Magnetococcus marinus (strain ATCC BAA-1437 / JCM 17883 / MC-1) TaxID=156889 RepID=A0L6F8_MAGMM|nr:lipoprotein-releasing ABC transporter permease subunit [Magnetococcus marinus]ABK43551.1 lipoprotein releasing system, transmembrane protein, LolC/E family [Magnetococcus marinus MC-1]